MSLPWREALRIYLHPEEVALVRLGRGPRRPVLEKSRIPCQAASEGPPWARSVAAFAEALKTRKAWKGDLVVVLSNHFARYALLPWSIRLSDPHEERALARILFEETHGDAARNWEIRVSDEPFGAPRVASAVDRELLSALDRLAAEAGLRPASVQPYLMVAFNLWRKSFPDGECLFLAAEPGRLSLCWIDGGKWRAVRSLALRKAAELPALIERERLRLGVEPKVAQRLFAPAEPGLKERFGAGAPEILALSARRGFSPYADAPFGPALAGVA